MLGKREIILGRGAHIVGRSPHVAVFVDDGGVSRHHARITIDAAGATLEDLESKNGTMLDRQIVRSPLPLADGSLIVVGATALRFRVLAPFTSTETISR